MCTDRREQRPACLAETHELLLVMSTTGTSLLLECTYSTFTDEVTIWGSGTNDHFGVAIWSLQAASHYYLVHCQQDLLKSVPQGQYGRLTCLKQGDMDERGSRVMAELNCPPKTLKKGLFPSHLSPPHGRR